MKSTAYVLDAVAQYFDVTVLDMKHRSRMRSIAIARNLACFLLRKHTQLSYSQIGELLGNRDHTTILSNSRTGEKLSRSVNIDVTCEGRLPCLPSENNGSAKTSSASSPSTDDTAGS